MSSIRAIAQEAGVSITTVSRALNNDAAVNPKTRASVLAIANRKGYVATVGRRVTTNIGLVYTCDQTLAQPFDASIIAGIARGVDECRFDLVILDLLRDKRAKETYTQFFMRKSVRGVIVRTNSDTRDVCQVIAEEGFPHVIVAERFEDPRVNYIDSESKSETVRAINYLTSLGHRRIAMALHNEPDRDHEDRLEGYREALESAGLPFEEGLVFRQKFTLVGGGTVMNMVASMLNRPTAIYLADPLLAVGAVKKAHDLGLSVPGDISIIGFDDTDVRYSVHPTMTAVCQDAAALGFESALALTRILKDVSKGPFRKTIPTFFEVHESTGPPPSEVRAV